MIRNISIDAEKLPIKKSKIKCVLSQHALQIDKKSYPLSVGLCAIKCVLIIQTRFRLRIENSRPCRKSFLLAKLSTIQCDKILIAKNLCMSATVTKAAPRHRKKISVNPAHTLLQYFTEMQ